MLHEQHPYWSAWSRAVISRPRTVIAVALLFSAALGLQAWWTPKDLAFTGLLDEDDVDMHHFMQTVETFGANSMLVLLLEGPRSDIDAAVEALVDELPQRTDIKSITPPADPQWLIDRGPWVWPRPMFETVVSAVESGERPKALLTTLDSTDDLIRKALRPVDEAALVGIGLDRSPLDMAMGGRDFFAIKSEVEAILDEHGFPGTHAFTGIVATAAQDQASVMTRIKILSPITLCAVLVLLMGVERRLSRVLLAGLALSFSVFIAFGMTGLVLGRLSITVTFFGMLLLGLGIDFGIHLLVALRDARSHGKSPEEAVRFGIRHTATAIALGGISTALAFGVISLAPEPGARDMGFAALFGLLAAMLLMLTFLPAAWLLLERRHASTDAPPRFYLPGLHRLVGFSLEHPVIVVAVAVAATLWGLAGIPRYKLESDLAKIISRQVTSFEVDQRLEELFGVSPVTYLAPVDSLEQAREWSKELIQLDDIAAVSSVADVILPDAEDRVQRVQALLETLPPNLQSGPLYERLARAGDAGPVTVETLPANISNGLVGENGELAISIVPKENVMDAFVLADQIERVQAIAPTATGMPFIIKMAVLGRRDYIPIMIPAILLVVTIVLTVAFRSLRDVVLGLIPVLMGTAISFGVFLWADLQMSVLTGIVVPVILGLGVDDGIHVVERIRQYRYRSDQTLHEAVEGVGRAIFLTTATTCVSFVTLLFTDHPGLEGIAHFMLIGIPLCFVLSVTVLPAAAKLMAGDQPSAELAAQNAK